MKNVYTFLAALLFFEVSGQEIKLVKDLTPGSESSDISILYSGSDKILLSNVFLGADEILLSDGSEEGTKVLIPASQGESFGKVIETKEGFLHLFTKQNNVTYVYEINLEEESITPIKTLMLKYSLSDCIYTKEKYIISSESYLYFYDVKSGFNSEIGSYGLNILGFCEYKEEVYFIVGSSGKFDLYKTNGTKAGTKVVKNLADSFTTQTKSIYFTELNGKLLFGVVNAFELDSEGMWVSDGTEEGTIQLVNMSLDENYAKGKTKAILGDKLYFVGKEHGGDISDIKIYETDGTISGTKKIEDGESIVDPGHLVAYRGELYFHNSYEKRIYKIEESKYKEVYDNSYLMLTYDNGVECGEELTTFDDRLYSTGVSSANGIELWESGTESNDIKQYDIVSGATGSKPEQLTSTGKLLFFTATTAATGRELYVFDPNKSAVHKLIPEDIIIIPNPATDRITLPGHLAGGDMEVMTARGEVITNRRLVKKEMDVSSLTPGVYFVRIKHANKIYQTRFIKI